MSSLYFALAAFHLLAVVVTGVLWFLIDVQPKSPLRPFLRDIRAVHFGSLYLVSIFLGLAYALEKRQVPARDWLAFPLGLAALIVFSGFAYLFPRDPTRDPFYYWTRGWPLVLASIGTMGMIAGILWTAWVLIR